MVVGVVVEGHIEEGPPSVGQTPTRSVAVHLVVPLRPLEVGADQVGVGALH